MANQTHIVEEWQPANTDALLIILKSGGNHLFIVKDVAMCDHHTLGIAGRSRGVLQKGQAVGIEGWRTPQFQLFYRQRVGGQDEFLGQLGALSELSVDFGPNRLCRQRDFGLCIAHDCIQTRHRAFGMGWISRYGNHTCIETTKKSGDKG